MKSCFSAFLAASLLTLTGCAKDYALKPGDIVFQVSKTTQGVAVQQATGSPYTHCGVIFDDHGTLKVLEAVGPVKVTPVKEFVAASDPGTFCAKRLKNPISPEAFAKGSAWAASQLGKSYDTGFQWSDDRIYCSELVWKAYAAAGVQLCKPRPFKSYDLKQPAVKQIVAKRYGSIDKLPLDELAVAPGDLANSPLLADVAK
ncbi:MAG: putative peptidoglycan peptidase [Akkermansiaceae bacterium]|nr:putative peptidoglycan peptidase [Akkermansiaceae bacterium]